MLTIFRKKATKDFPGDDTKSQSQIGSYLCMLPVCCLFTKPRLWAFICWGKSLSDIRTSDRGTSKKQFWICQNKIIERTSDWSYHQENARLRKINIDRVPLTPENQAWACNRKLFSLVMSFVFSQKNDLHNIVMIPDFIWRLCFFTVSMTYIPLIKIPRQN